MLQTVIYRTGVGCKCKCTPGGAINYSINPVNLAFDTISKNLEERKIFRAHGKGDFVSYCEWASKDELHRVYHDTEWGIPVHDDKRMFEHLSLECLQRGLSWVLMLKKRNVFRECFANFGFDKVAAFDETDVERILSTEGMIHSRRKVEAIINNARCYQKVRQEFGSFCRYLWNYTGGKTILYSKHHEDNAEIPVSNGLSYRISKDLKKRGFKYVGPITIYSHLQACGIINDHSESCPCYFFIVQNYPCERKCKDNEVY